MPLITQEEYVKQEHEGIASWFNTPERRSCASNFYPVGTRLRVTYGGKEVLVRVIGTGPNKNLNRLIDLSPDAFLQLAPLTRGLVVVKVTLVEG